MAIDTVVTDPSLKAVLIASREARQQAIDLLTLTSSPTTAALPPATAALQISKQQKLLNGYLAQLRGLQRQATFGARDIKAQTAEARQEVDRLHLQLQNLYYEQRHLQGEIAACEAYDHKYLELPLIPESEFLALFPAHVGADEEALMAARIEHEHAEREALEQQRQGLLKMKQGLIADNKRRKEDLASLDKQLENFIDAAKPIQKTLEKRYDGQMYVHAIGMRNGSSGAGHTAQEEALGYGPHQTSVAGNSPPRKQPSRHHTTSFPRNPIPRPGSERAQPKTDPRPTKHENKILAASSEHLLSHPQVIHSALAISAWLHGAKQVVRGLARRNTQYPGRPRAERGQDAD
ncbi:hypothetical protein V502_03800 [Pseudogymnoascus sp. VKM F-4520 (FW-2644)]|nr:hypothetical protein V502_03800 [Pseudogymnoascus sp. VKM F-4520 (FW-2644)]